MQEITFINEEGEPVTVRADLSKGITVHEIPAELEWKQTTQDEDGNFYQQDWLGNTPKPKK